MKEPEDYRGREQTYLKHYFLERYLERVAYNIGWGGDFVYVDGFSGPWRSEDEELEDTSFIIAVNKLRVVRDSLAKMGEHLDLPAEPPEVRARTGASRERLVRAIRGAVLWTKRLSGNPD